MQPGHQRLASGVAPAIRNDNAFCRAVLDDNLLHRSRSEDIAAMRAQTSGEGQRQLQRAALGDAPSKRMARAGAAGKNRAATSRLVREDSALNGSLEYMRADMLLVKKLPDYVKRRAGHDPHEIGAEFALFQPRVDLGVLARRRIA